MRLAPFANETDVDEALRLFHVSTLSSAGSGNLAGTRSSPSSSLSHISSCSIGIEGFTTREDQEEISRVEKQVRRRFVIGSQVSEHVLVQDFIRQVRRTTFTRPRLHVPFLQNYSERTVYKVLHAMVRRGDVQYRMQRKVLIRVR